MSTKVVNIPVTDLRSTMRDLIKAHDVIHDEIMTHAEKHEAMMDARRHDAARQRAIDAGIKKQRGNV